MKTISEILKLSALFLEKRQIVRSRRLAEDLLAHVLNCKRIDLYLQFDRPLIAEEADLMREGVRKLAFGYPLEYIVGEVSFYGCRIKVDSRVLIPRQETEILVDLIAKKNPRGVLWDLCSGSGCIGIALKKKFPHLAVALADLSSEALALAQENARLNETDVELLHGDLLTPFIDKKADWVVCNPPYVTAREYFTLDRSVRDFEPRMALVGGEVGTEFYERLASEMFPFLNSGARVALEIGASQGEAIKRIFSSPMWRKQELFFDWSKKDRFFFLEKQ